MPAPETFERNQKAVLWMVTDQCDNYGNNKVSDPVEIDVRWEDVRQSSRGSETNPTSITAVVVVDRQILENSIMWKGALADYTGSTDKLCEVQTYDETPDIKGREIRRVVTLNRYKGALAILAPGTGS